MSTRALDEFGRIASYFAPLAASEPGTFRLTDDAAVVDFSGADFSGADFSGADFSGAATVITADMLVADVHFLKTDPADGIARKALRVNLSDLAAMGAEPVAYTLCLATPGEIDDAWVGSFADGLRRDQDSYGVTLIGGDSVSTGGGPLTVSITAFGRLPVGTAVRRSGAGQGDDVYVSGTIGDGALGLLVARGELADREKGARAALLDRYHLPRPRTRLGPALRGLATAMMDVSDGLVQDAGHMARLSGARIDIDRDRIPLSAAAAACVAADPEGWETILGGGDDYELLFTAPPGKADAVAAAADRTDTAVTRVGRVSATGPGEDPEVQILQSSGGAFEVRSKGYRHFRT